MRLVFVNHLHPQEPLVGAVRLREFAEAMARRGHAVVLLTAPRGDEAGDDPDTLVERVRVHDWKRPLVVAPPLQRFAALEGLRRGTLPRPLRAALVAGLYLGRGGVFPDWSLGAAAVLPILAEQFRPEAVWGTFGNTDAWLIARALARRAGCPWVMDVKDKWDAFIPAPFRPLLARRFDDAAAMTALARSYLDHVRPRFSCPGRVVYSGVSQALLSHGAEGEAESRLTLSGSTYSPATLAALMEGIRGWIRPDMTFTYAGADHRRVAEAAVGLNCIVDVRGQLSPDELAELQRRSFVNLYCCIGDLDRFHHKLIELLCVGRPIVCLPPDGPEAAGIAASVGGDFTGCADAGEVSAALDSAWARRFAPMVRDAAALADFGWDGQARVLEEVFTAALSRRSCP